MADKSETKTKDSAVFPIVAMGASAGGLEALQAFFDAMPPDSGMAFIVIQHLSPSYKSNMVSLLERHTKMTVRQIEDGMTVAPNCVYLNAPNSNLTILDRTLQMLPVAESPRVNLPIDFFFRALAKDRREKAVAIVLSGTATDGTLGIKAIKGEGGMVMVQDPETAEYDGMPRSAIGTDLVDFILPVEEMPETLTRYVRHPFINRPGDLQRMEPHLQNQLQKVFSLIRNATGNDFSHYKRNTIHRRIERRLAVHQIEKLSEYVAYLQKKPAEIQILFKDLVIGVTNFFRDPKAFDSLEKEALLDLISKKNTDAPLRIWVVGCSTGEEAYSLGMLVFEIMERLNRHFAVKIFASDIDENAIDYARMAVYPKSIAADVSRNRLKKFFTQAGDSFKIKKHIREMVVFSIHNIASDPPFSRLDLVSCRNLLIYLDTVLQKRILPIFHYTLNPGGILFLGTSETIGENTDLFEPVNSKWKIFMRKPGIQFRNGNYQGPNHFVDPGFQEKRGVKRHHSAADIPAMAEKILLDEYAPSGVVVDQNYEIIHFIGKTDKYLVPPVGRASFNILNMAREEIKYKLGSLLHNALRRNEEIVCWEDLNVRNGSQTHPITICIKPLTGARPDNRMLLVVFKETAPQKTSDDTSDEKKQADLTGSHVKDPTDPRIASLEQELQSTREYLQATIEELETANEELKSTNEELQSLNEELQSANEELETSKEELQSTNEELTTVNTELQDKVNEVSKASDDLSNLLAATDIASIFLETNLNIKRFTPAMARIANLIQTDVGRPLTDLKNSFPDTDIIKLAKNVLKDLNTIEVESLSQDNIWYAIKIMPYRTTENIIDGVVMTFINIEKIRKSDDRMRRFSTVLEDSSDAIVIQDLKGMILAWNHGAEKMYGWAEKEVLNRNIDLLIPKERKGEAAELTGKLIREEDATAFTTQRITKSGKLIKVWLTATLVKDKTGRPMEIAVTERNLEWLAEKGC